MTQNRHPIPPENPLRPLSSVSLNHGWPLPPLHPSKAPVKAPIDEFTAKHRTRVAMAEWQKALALRRLVFLTVAMWGLIGVFVWLCNRNWLAILDILFPGK